MNNFFAFILYKFNHGLWLKFYADTALNFEITSKLHRIFINIVIFYEINFERNVIKSLIKTNCTHKIAETSLKYQTLRNSKIYLVFLTYIENYIWNNKFKKRKNLIFKEYFSQIQYLSKCLILIISYCIISIFIISMKEKSEKRVNETFYKYFSDRSFLS